MKYQVNYARAVRKTKSGDPLPFGPFGTLLVSQVGGGKSAADKITVRTTADVAEKVGAKMAEARKAGKVITVEADFTESEVDGKIGVRTETWVNDEGTAIEQTALYIRFASTPTWGIEVGKNDVGNLDSL